MLRATLRVARRLTRIALTGAVVLLFAVAGLVLVLRYQILPDIGRYHGDITARVSRAIGQPVIIGKIEADWRGIRPHFLFTDVLILDKQGQTALVLPFVDNVVSWMTLLTGEVRLYSLEINHPDLLVKRDGQGMLHIAGMALSGQIAGQPSDANWLLHQARIVVRDARITWQDEQRLTPPLVLNQVSLIMENSGQRHRFSLRAQPPEVLSAQLDLRGDFIGKSFDDLNTWGGQLYVQLDYADVAAWRAWLPLPNTLQRGRGAVRGWLGAERGKVTQFTADLSLADVQTRLADDLPPLNLRSLRGRVSWRETEQEFEVSTRKFSLRMNDGLMLPPTDFYLRLADAKDAQAASGEMRANNLELINLTSLTDFLPLERNLKQHLAEFAPQGRISDLHAKWQGNAGKLLHYDIKARFDGMSLRRVGDLPGFSGLSGQVNGTDASGSLTLMARKLTVDAPHIMPEPLEFDLLTAQSSWQSNENGMKIKFNDVSVANADLAGNFFGSYQTLPASPGLLDLTVHLTRAAVRHTDRYIPLVALDSQAHAWIRDGLLDGQADEFSLRLQGDLNDFPFDGGRKGIFQIQARAKGVAVEYAQGWPRIENADAELSIKGRRLQVTAPGAMTSGGYLQKVSVVLPDMLNDDLLLQVSGEVEGETQRCLDFIQRSPVRGYLDGFTDGITARGKGKLALRLDIPLRGSKPLAVSGSYHFIDNDVNFGSGVPALMKTSGDLVFTESSLRTRNITTHILGGPATLLVQSGDAGMLQVRASGRVDLDNLRKTDTHPLLQYLHGSSPWQAELSVVKKHADILLTSNLLGLTSDLPAPFSKRATESIPLRFEKKSMPALQDRVSLRYGDLLDMQLLGIEDSGNMNIKRGVVSFGHPSKWPSRDGVWLAGALPELSLEGWGTLIGGSSFKQGVTFDIAGIDLLIQKISGYGYKTDNLRINTRNHKGILVTQLASKAINGEMKWQAQDGGRLVARVKNVYLDKDDEVRGQQADAQSSSNKKMAATPESVVVTRFPAIDMVVDSIMLNGNPLGKLELLAQQHERDWVLEQMRLTNPDGLLTADGKWFESDGAEKTQLNFKLEINNAGNVLARSGYPNTVKRGSGKLDGTFEWRGGPPEFSYAALDGTLNLDAHKGQFLKIDPGVGKLLSLLSLQSLPKHITLDFTDVFSDGFAFDSITGKAQIRNGILASTDFKIDGSAAKVTMSGQVDLDRETQNLRIRILPTVGNSVSLLGAFAAGPAVGVGVFLANKILRDPLDRLVSFEYNLTGTWSDPNVEKVGGNKPAK